MVTFQTDDWLFVEAELKRHLQNQRDVLENSKKTYRELLEARARAEILKTFLNLPQSVKLIAAKQG